jgi:hypothetical protein
MRTEHLMNKSVERYRCASLIGEVKPVMELGKK